MSLLIQCFTDPATLGLENIDYPLYTGSAIGFYFLYCEYYPEQRNVKELYVSL